VRSYCMQGKKVYAERLFTSFQLSDHVPEENFYRRLKGAVDFGFIQYLTRGYYGKCGQKSIDPEVFIKLMLVGYLENIISDRKLMQHCAMRMDILFFLGYNIDEPLPWHSTLSRTRALLPDDIFTAAFEKVLDMCIDKGMVSGHTQAIDSAPVKANASMDTLELKVPKEDLDQHLRKVRAFSAMDRSEDDFHNHQNPTPPMASAPSRRDAKTNRASVEQQTITADQRSLKEIRSRNLKWSTTQTERPGARNKNSKYTSNKTHYSPVDPDARISVKPGKARKLNYAAQMSVDTEHHVITHIQADLADKKDSQILQDFSLKLKNRLHAKGFLWHTLLADTGYSSGENYAFLEQQGIESYIPPHGTYKGGPEGFTYHRDGDYWLCSQGQEVTFRKIQIEKSGNRKKLYLTKPSQCKGCPIKRQCIGGSPERRITITAYMDEYERAIKRVRSKKGRALKVKRSATVEPVFGTLTEFMGMRKVNTRGIANANKGMLMAATAYNLKKFLKFIKKDVRSAALSAEKHLLNHLALLQLILSPNRSLKI
jgi:transposase